MSADTPSPFGPSGRAGARLTDVEAVKADEATELVAVVVKANLAEHIAEHRDAQAFVGPLS